MAALGGRVELLLELGPDFKAKPRFDSIKGAVWDDETNTTIWLTTTNIRPLDRWHGGAAVAGCLHLERDRLHGKASIRFCQGRGLGRRNGHDDGSTLPTFVRWNDDKAALRWLVASIWSVIVFTAKPRSNSFVSTTGWGALVE